MLLDLMRKGMPEKAAGVSYQKAGLGSNTYVSGNARPHLCLDDIAAGWIA
jgi:hypothetical protein